MYQIFFGKNAAEPRLKIEKLSILIATQLVIANNFYNW
ncbi:hypothetical protein MuYL_4396 [Mucilaginibacter xinganensis]|uniref:Uncharacterized protein n=1 Tax=Mucilaginibacter xinganensis TaxID=1234841 RepID=A0A223P389_9SPHI|nr:hypothetical protein MuYL_4396 [Mucilaginibacter xinganensis]